MVSPPEAAGPQAANIRLAITSNENTTNERLDILSSSLSLMGRVGCAV
jgi:hypothetical protein